MLDITLYCYRLSTQSYDEELIWRDVQLWGGHLSIRGDCVDFWVPGQYISFFLLRYPELVRQPQLEYV